MRLSARDKAIIGIGAVWLAAIIITVIHTTSGGKALTGNAWQISLTPCITNTAKYAGIVAKCDGNSLLIPVVANSKYKASQEANTIYITIFQGKNSCARLLVVKGTSKPPEYITVRAKDNGTPYIVARIRYADYCK